MKRTTDVRTTKSLGRTALVFHIIATRDREFFQMEHANTAQLSRSNTQATHSIVHQTNAAESRNSCHRELVKSARRMRSAGASTALNRLVVPTSTWMNTVSAEHAQQDTSRPQTKEAASSSTA